MGHTESSFPRKTHTSKCIHQELGRPQMNYFVMQLKLLEKQEQTRDIVSLLQEIIMIRKELRKIEINKII